MVRKSGFYIVNKHNHRILSKHYSSKDNLELLIVLAAMVKSFPEAVFEILHFNGNEWVNVPKDGSQPTRVYTKELMDYYNR